MGRLIVISQRAPRPDPAEDAGGLVVALRSTLEAEGGLWFGISGDTVEDADADLEWQESTGFSIGLMGLTEAEHQGQYLGFANGVIWPVFHNRIDLSHFDQSDFEIYRAVSARMAREVAPHIRAEDLVWVHDYQLIPVAAELRALGVDCRIGFFLHIPWPSVDSFQTIPEAGTLLADLAAYDLIGLQSRRDARNFANCAIASGEGEWLPGGRMRIGTETVELGHFPISIDVDEFTATAEAGQGEIAFDLIGVERLDYSKGLPQRFAAYEVFLANHGDSLGKVRFLQIAPTSRGDLDAYRDIADELDQRAGRVNGTHGTLDWMPMHYIRQPVARDTVAGLLRRARVGVVTPLMDGMNLVAKEFVAAQDGRDPGVLVLSRFAGAAEELDGALIVNPYDIEAMAAAYARALLMSLAERRDRHAAMLDTLKGATIHDWAASYLSALRRPDGDNGYRLTG